MTDNMRLEDTDLRRICSLKTGGNACVIERPESERELIAVVEKLTVSRTKFAVIGKGSNVVFLDAGYDGVIVQNTRACREIQLLEAKHRLFGGVSRIYVGSSVSNQKLIKYCINNGLDAPTYLQSVPGNVGGAVAMNAGTGVDEARYVSEYITRVKLFDGKEVFWLAASECGFAYRQSFFHQSNDTILGAEFGFSRRSSKKVQALARERGVFAKRTQDDTKPNAGSVFNRGYVDIPEIRGMAKGQAQFSQKTCNWIINNGEASSSDVMYLVDQAKKIHMSSGYSEPKIEWHILR